MNRAIGFYETEAGNVPVEKFIRSLDRRDQARVLAVFEYVEQNEQVPASMLKKMVNTPDLWEVRVNTVFFGFYASLMGRSWLCC